MNRIEMVTVMNNELTVTFQDFLNFFRREYGINILAHQYDNVRLAIDKTCTQYSVLMSEELLNKISADVNCAERKYLIEKITIDESYFFRDELQISFLKNEFLPQLIADKRKLGDKQLRIWSAGCSTGQEIYSLAIILHQLLPDYEEWNLHLIGTDINHQSLHYAQQGEYNLWGIRAHQDFVEYSGYFNKVAENKYALNDFIKRRVTFSYLNLAEGTFPSIMQGVCALDLILCRNVFIYFDPQTISATYKKFSESLNMHGVLMLAATDPIADYCQQLKVIHNHGIFYFKKTFEFSLDTAVTDAQSSRSNISPSVLLLSDTETDANNLEALKRSIISEFSVANWTNALEKIEQALLTNQQEADLLQFKAKCLINLGRTSQAKVACEQSLLYNAIEPHSYLLYGLILLQLSLLDEAEKAFRQTIFLNASFMEAHYQLGQVMLSKGLKKEAMKSIRNAIGIAEKEQPNRAVHNVIALTYSSFSEAMKNELELIKQAT